MKNKVMILIVVGILIVGGISVSYAAGRNNASLNNFSRPMMGAQNNGLNLSNNYKGTMMGTQNGGIQLNDNFNNMIKIMKDNGFSDEAIAMENRDFDSMNNLMNNISDEDYKTMINIMQKNGYSSMGKMMQDLSSEDMIEIHQTMMGR